MAACPTTGEAFDWGDDKHSRHEAEIVLYELHVRGFTADPSSGVSGIDAAPLPASSKRFRTSRISASPSVELMPVFQCDPQEGNYWGYMPLNFFAPHHSYASRPATCDQHDEFRDMVKALHEAGIEVILDVVYNHTAEGDQNGPDLQLQGHRQQHLLHDLRQPGEPLRELTPAPATPCTAPTATCAR